MPIIYWNAHIDILYMKISTHMMYIIMSTITFLNCNPVSFLYTFNISLAFNKLHETNSSLLANKNNRLYFNNILFDKIMFIGHLGE